ncbi:MAG: hypothetical protein IPM42_10840 [Saprospiraceae bacterium]|nr:hypothetical protein [Saprospiraceae bacterium]
MRLDQNDLTGVPQEIGNLNKLEKLWLQNDKYEPIKNNFDTRIRLPRKNNNIKTLPASLNKLTSLVDFRIAKNDKLSGDVLNLFFQMPQTFEAIDLSYCSISKLPQYGWENFKCMYLDLRYNQIDTVSNDIFHFGNFKRFDLTNNPYSGLSNTINSKSELMVIGYEHGVFTLDKIKKQPDIVEALMSLSSRYTYRNDENPILRYYPLALEVNISKANALLDHEKYADALFKAGRYKEAILPYEKSIERDLKSCIIVTNWMIPKIYNAAKAYLYSGDTISCLKKYELLYEMFDVPLNAETGMLYYLLDNNIKADSFLKKEEEKLLNEIENKTLTDWWGNELSLLEIYLLRNQSLKFTNYIIELKSLTPPDMKSQLLLEYFILIKDVMSGKDINNNIITFENKIKSEKINFNGWSCRLMDLWVKKLDIEKRNIITKLNSLICIKN